jgi:outer membrane receptor for ferric coprogen and ferric-rhodotorulic acid
MTFPNRYSFLNPYRIVTLLLLGIALVAAASAQNPSLAILSGIVTDENKDIIPSAKLTLKDEKGFVRETSSDEGGSFSFGELPFGSYRLIVRKEGFTDSEREIKLDGANRISDLTLAAGAVSETVTIVLDSAEAAAESTLKLPVSIHETPRSLTIIGSERITEQNFRQVPDVFNYTPGTTANSYRNGSYHFYSRGYRMGPDDTRLDGFAGINVGSNGFGASTFGIEEIVILRGPASLIYGQTGSPGGLINLVSKRPQEKRFTRIDLRGAGYSGNGVSLGERPSFGIDIDSSGAITKNERILYRGLATLENMNYFSKDTEDRNRYVNGSLLFKLDSEGRFVLTPSLQYTRYNRPYGGGIIASPSSSLTASTTLLPSDPVGAPINLNDLSPLDVNLYSGRRIEETGWAGLDFRGVVSEKIRVNAAYRLVSFNTDINQFAPQVNSVSQILQLRDQHTVSRIQAKSLTERKYNNFNADASYEWLNNAFVRNTTQVGFYSRVLDSRSTKIVPGQPPILTQSAINVYTGQVVSPLVDNHPVITFDTWGKDIVWNGFVQNRTSLDHGRWNIMLGFNYGENDPAVGAVRKSGIIPNASIVFNAMPELAIYGSYSTSFNPTDPNLQNEQGVRGTFDPTIGKNFEFGAKYDLLNRRVGLTIAAFQNQIDNVLVASDTLLNAERYYIPAGTRRARGAEATGEFQVRQDLRVTAGVSYTDAIYKGFPSGAAVSSSPIPNSWAEKTPHWSYNVYTRYDRKEGYLKGFGAGLGLAWQGKRLGSNGARTFASPDPLVLPSFTRVDSALYYKLTKYVNFALNVDNLLDEVIFVNASVGSSIEIAAPRTMTFRTSFNF